MINQNKLIKLIKQHDRVAQKQLYHDYVNLFFHISMRYINNEHSAQDATQNTFVRVFQNIEKYDSSKGKIKSWIARIAVNESIALLRKQKKVIFSPIDISIVMIDQVVDSKTLDKMELEDVTHVINKLDDENRIIMELYFYEEYSHKEIAELLGISQEGSRIKLYRAKKSFYKQWDKIKKYDTERAI